jgi:hypothetical protein
VAALPALFSAAESHDNVVRREARWMLSRVLRGLLPERAGNVS